MNWYRLKRAVLAPYIWYKRYRTRHLSGFIKAALELHYYRPTFYRFMGATMARPDILHQAPLTKGDIVLDVGAYIGDWTARVYENYQPRIYLFEPDPPSVRRLQTRFAGYPDIRCFDYGLGGRNCEMELLQRGMGSTFYEPAGNTDHETISLAVRDIVGVLDELGHDQIDLVKLNVEGGEYDVLERLIEAGRLSTIRCFMIQFHEWFDGAHKRRRHIRRALRKTHEQTWNYPFVWEMWIRKR